MTEVAAKAKKWLESPWMNTAFRVIAVVSLLLGFGVGIRQYELTECLAEYNEASNKATAARAEAAGSDRKALDDMVKAIADAYDSGDRTATRKALNDYLVSRARGDGQRQGNPLPAPPSQTCG